MRAREAVRQFVRYGLVPAEPLFGPVVFTLAAKVEGLGLDPFVNNPTKIANSIRAVYRQLPVQVMTSYYDPTLIAEAAGCRVDWSVYPPLVQVGGEPALPPTAEVLRWPRVGVALDVTERLRRLEPDRVIIAGLPGPWLVARQLRFTGRPEAELLDHCTGLVQALAGQLCQKGADIIIADEGGAFDPPARWAEAVIAVWNVVAFHGALLVIAAGPAPAGLPVRYCRPHDCRPTGEPCVLLVPPEGVPDGPLGCCKIVLTDGEIPYTYDIRALPDLVGAIRQRLTAGR